MRAKKCPTCGRTYIDDTLSFCLEDGAPLVYDDPSGEAATARFQAAPAITADSPTRTFDGAAQSAETTRNYGVTDASDGRRIWIRYGTSVLALIVLIAGGVWAYRYFSARGAGQIESIAVMPFTNESGKPEMDYLSDGMTETLINSLAQLPNLTVKARSTVFTYKGKDVSPKQVGSELAVNAVLNGRVAQRGEALTLSLELVDASTGDQIWGEKYDRKFTDLAALQGDIARDVSNKLRSRLSGAQQQRVTKSHTRDNEAYQLYLKGRYQWNKRTDEGFTAAAEFFNRAIARDPEFALAYVGLADSYLLGGLGDLSRWERVAKARGFAQRALEIDPGLGEAHNTLANIKHWDDWDWDAAEKGYRKAIELSPNYSTAHHWYGESLIAMGRFDEGFREFHRALELDPLSLAISSDLGMAYYYARQFDAAIAEFKKAIEVDPDYVRTHFYLVKVYEEKGMFEEAVGAIERGMILGSGDSDQPHQTKKRILAGLKASGAQGYWREVLNFTLTDARQKDREPDSIEAAKLYVRLGEPDSAFRYLERAIKERRTDLVFLKVSPEWDGIRDDPRFADVLHRVGLPLQSNGS